MGAAQVVEGHLPHLGRDEHGTPVARAESGGVVGMLLAMAAPVPAAHASGETARVGVTTSDSGEFLEHGREDSPWPRRRPVEPDRARMVAGYISVELTRVDLSCLGACRRRG